MSSMSSNPDPGEVLAEVRSILRVPESVSIIQHARDIMVLLDDFESAVLDGSLK